ncbi:hypothetical protein [Streptomyces sp. NPDC048442]|uniref:hypothetical protein n=1 Tax=Streptomyces sp. NPDC048442 TaxID=3154823 RepID=UPI0034389377
MTVGAAAAVLVAACGLTACNDKKDAGPVDPKPTATPSAPKAQPSNIRGKYVPPKPVVAGWKTVVNPKLGIAFDVPPQWDRKESSWVSYVAENTDPQEKPLVGFTAPGILKEQWCTSDDDRDGNREETALASAGSRGESHAKSADEAARNTAGLWLYGAYTQPDRTRAKAGPAQPYTTASGLKGSLASATSTGLAQKAAKAGKNPVKPGRPSKPSKPSRPSKAGRPGGVGEPEETGETVAGKCTTDGKVSTFAFTGGAGKLVSWSFVGAKGVPEEVPDATVRKIVSTVRLVK